VCFNVSFNQTKKLRCKKTMQKIKRLSLIELLDKIKPFSQLLCSNKFFQAIFIIFQDKFKIFLINKIFLKTPLKFYCSIKIHFLHNNSIFLGRSASALLFYSNYSNLFLFSWIFHNFRKLFIHLINFIVIVNGSIFLTFYLV
jgi:hypothetical protein